MNKALRFRLVRPVARSGEKKSKDRVLAGKPDIKNHSED
jgi:hypothetical protein